MLAVDETNKRGDFVNTTTFILFLTCISLFLTFVAIRQGKSENNSEK
ncbi:hypothetical protein RU97_GL001153 [Enterococcus canis]|uniref:Holin-like toxin n=1 Tax=Enterococcus canis TaxID=214095 RepID=A0A1L8RIP9_9ENTE|nr:hypothetical protein RU97_GL001153 [Enterococcus canis]